MRITLLKYPLGNGTERIVDKLHEVMRPRDFDQASCTSLLNLHLR